MNFDGVRTQIKRLLCGVGKGGNKASFFCAIKWRFSGVDIQVGIQSGYSLGGVTGYSKQGFGVVR